LEESEIIPIISDLGNASAEITLRTRGFGSHQSPFFLRQRFFTRKTASLQEPFLLAYTAADYLCCMTTALTISPASTADIPALVALVNSAYRGESSKKGWTTEADLLDGQRTDPASMENELNKPGSVILKCADSSGRLLGCVYLERQNNFLYLGMLTVLPEMQGAGIGKQLLQASERYATEHGFSSIRMTVISIRRELIDWYERQGYSDTLIRRPFPAGDPKFGIPRQELEFIVMEKLLHNAPGNN